MLSDEIKKTRQKGFLTQTEFAEALGVSFSTINRWEAGKSRPNLTAMKNLKDFCAEKNLPYEQIENEWLESSAQN